MVYMDRDPLKQVTILDVQWSNIPEDVYDEVVELWRTRELGNDYYYVPWNSEEDRHEYPLIAEYLDTRGVKECLIHWWW